MCLAQPGALGEVHVFDNADFTDLTALTTAFLADAGTDPAGLQGRFAVACPVEGDHVSLTNRDWRFTIPAVRDSLGLNSLQVCNDFSALALALPWLDDSHVVQLTGGTALDRSTKLVLGPGTGLGVSALVPCGDDWVAVEGEGGHVSFAPQNGFEVRLLESLWQRFEHISAERVLAGPGLALAYQVIGELEQGTSEALAPQDVVARARAGETQAQRTLDVYFAMLGSVAGNLALALGARGGVFLAGGILPRTVAELSRSRYREAFVDKGRLRDYLTQIPSYLIVHPHPALLGLLRAREMPRS
jgi:glucokinase